ncbi:MAG: glycoside hydrolase family 97 catalytic domain-containing protein [Bacteroidota bacterium]|nr:glycoside hydrolase family 97 catalytic domain-containing protein [Bacteroidota bacterium]
MINRKLYKWVGLLILIFGTFSLKAQIEVKKDAEAQIKSPDGNIELHFRQTRDTQGKSHFFYQVSYKKQLVILESELNINFDNHLSENALALKADKHERWCENLNFKKIVETSKDTVWKPVYGERNLVRDNYNQTTLQFVKDDNAHYELYIDIRAYNEGVAFRYSFPEDKTGVFYHVTSENDQFAFPGGTQAFVATWAQGAYNKLPLSNWPDESERPLTLSLTNGLYVCLAEAQMVDYVRTKYKLSTSKPNTVETSMYGAVDAISPFSTPWRAIMIAEKATQLIENNDIVLNLNAPNALKNTSWIKPGKVIRELTLTNEGAKACIDFAAAHNLQYILFDWKWYGPVTDFASDATKVVVDLDMRKVVEYGAQKNVGIWLYVNQQALVSQLDKILPVYKEWGIKGIKFGFVQVGAQYWSTWLHDAVKKCAEYQLMVDIHDEYRPTGFSRTYPNLLNQEGIRGNEEMPEATHNTVLPFTRFIAGPADYTICYYKQKGIGGFGNRMIKTTSAHQLALAAIYYAPLQFMFWYDKPSEYQDEPEVEFFEKVPVSWDETKVIQGEIGQYITTARRSGDDWVIGSITNNDARSLKIPLNFLPKGKKYLASIYSDDPAVQTRTHVRIQRVKVDSASVIDAKLLPSGGQAIWLSAQKQ